MADHADDGGGNNGVFVYMGGDQEVPEDVTHVRVHKSVKIITRHAFEHCHNLMSIEMHDGVKIIEENAFFDCTYIKRIKLLGVRVIERNAFWNCTALEDVEFGNKLETIGEWAFQFCESIRNIKLPKIRAIEYAAFASCVQLMGAELSKDLETIGNEAFYCCPRLRRISIPLKNNLLGGGVFNECHNLSRVDIIGGIHKTISSLLLDSWRNKTKNVINEINRDLLNTDPDDKTAVIRQWMGRVIHRIGHLKMEHYTLLKEFTTLLELALWKAKLDESQDDRALGRDQQAKKAKFNMKTVRQEKRITSGASIVIKNVLPFLKLE